MTTRSEIRILLVEDEMLIRELAAEDLADAGFDVVAVATGDEAHALLKQDDNFQLLFTDIHMPGDLDGLALARRAREVLPNLPVIYATGMSEGLDPPGPRDRHVPKPYLIEDMLRLIAELCPPEG